MTNMPLKGKNECSLMFNHQSKPVISLKCKYFKVRNHNYKWVIKENKITTLKKNPSSSLAQFKVYFFFFQLFKFLCEMFFIE